jgi:hypothetical protein
VCVCVCVVKCSTCVCVCVCVVCVCGVCVFVCGDLCGDRSQVGATARVFAVAVVGQGLLSLALVSLALRAVLSLLCMVSYRLLFMVSCPLVYETCLLPCLSRHGCLCPGVWVPSIAFEMLEHGHVMSDEVCSTASTSHACEPVSHAIAHGLGLRV